MDNKCKIIEHLARHPGDTFTLHELSAALQIPYATFHRTVQRMGGLITMERKGKATIISIAWNEVTRAYLTIASANKREEFLKRHPALKGIAERAEPVTLLFGSYAKGTQRDVSDIDVLIITKTGKGTSFRTQELLLKKRINPIRVTKEEFTSMLNEKGENVGKQALRDHVVLSGAEAFWGSVGAAFD